jgi:hypothetical protein
VSASARPRTPLERVALAAVLVFLGLFALRKVGSPDAGWHIRTGRDIVAQRALPELDTYTYTVTDRANLATSWLYDVGSALVHDTLGPAGLTLAHAALLVLAFALALRAASLGPHDAGLLASLGLVGVLACEERFEVRPEVVSYAFLAAALLVLQGRSEGRPARVWTLVPLFWLWSNTHSLHVVGWGVLGCFVAGGWLRDRRVDLPLLAASAASVAVALLNPYGWRAMAQNLSLITRLREGQVFGETIAEYASPFTTLGEVETLRLHLVPVVALLAYALLTFLSLPGLVRQRRFSAILLALMGLGLALSMERNAPILVLATLPGTAWGLAQLVPGAGRARGFLAAGTRVGVVLLALVGSLRVVTDAYYADRGRLERFGLGWNPWLLPVDAAAWARASGLEGRVLNHLNFGGHLSLELGRPVFADGRLEVMGEEHYRYALRSFSSLEGLEAAAERYGADWVVLPYQVVPDLIGPLVADPGWRLVWFDHLAAIWVRAGTHQEVQPHRRVLELAQPAPDVDLGTVPGLGAVPHEGGLAGWLAGLVQRRTYPVESYCLSVFHYLRGDLARFAWYSADALRSSRGAHGELYGNLGSALLSAGLPEEARTCFVLAREDLPFYRAGKRADYDGLIADIERALAGRER